VLPEVEPSAPLLVEPFEPRREDEVRNEDTTDGVSIRVVLAWVADLIGVEDALPSSSCLNT
jgi:hypothetical protein